ncbi:MAG: tRNA (guanosine(46)-N7)-methyltransferase TrmB [Pyrinomonadaceae bacterium]|nr:tRNA (guanosine(46)-N7)-methyltransferase TrmB [Pyrinomonadaceae bacterium]
MGRVRVHQHVNPLAPYFRFTPNPIEIEKIFANPEMPILLDIGCARGRFLLQMADLDKTQNYIGIEIREALVNEGNRLAQEANLTNLHYEFSNAMVNLDKSIANFPKGLLQTVTIQFPDPWFKKKHAKRRMVNRQLVETVVEHLAENGRIFVQTDIEFLAEEMFELFRENEDLQEIEVSENPFPVKTEREKAVEDKDLPVYRRIFEYQKSKGQRSKVK